METLRDLRDVVNGKRRRFFNVSPEAAVFFKRWLADYHAAPTLEAVLDQHEMGHLLDDYLKVRMRCEKKHVVVEFVRPRAPWDGRGNKFNDEVMFLVLSFVTTSGCEKLRLCPRCGACFVAHGAQKFCKSLCGRRAAAARAAKEHYDAKRQKRIAACRAAYIKYELLKPKPRQPAAEYVLREANRRLPMAYKLGGPKMQTNFINRNAEAIGMPKGEK